ncbi:MAG: orotidine-5'-phosphate decarboxylase [Nitrospira bacterium HGW-Nitrospira-1]|nr:MAG: orotidine-5'-phosphate decarboxylase [Nitrospira bacterium HGW-Nitrospira-1]
MVEEARKNKGKLILALDVSEYNYAIELIDRFKDAIEIFKVGLELYTVAGPAIINEIHKRDRKVFLDLKFHDIPTTAARAGIAAARLGVFMFNVHASGGLDMMRKCREDVISFCLRENLNKPKIIGVTVLTSMSQETLKNEIGLQHSLNTQVRHLAGLALKAGLDGVVASAREAAMIRGHCGGGFLIVTPGIRPSWTAADDQMRTMTPKQAIQEGADFLVMGRAILNQPDPMKAIELIQKEMASA